MGINTYIYESITGRPGEKPRHFEIQQDSEDKPLTNHPETGEPIRRVVPGLFRMQTRRIADGGGCCSRPGRCG